MAGRKGFQRTLELRPPLDVCSSLMSMGSWLLLCILGVTAPGDDVSRQLSGISGFVILAAAIAAFMTGLALRCRAHRHMLNQLWAMPVVPQITEEEPLKASAVHQATKWSAGLQAVLLAGAIAWVVLHAVRCEDSQVRIGISTLYCIVSLSLVPHLGASTRADLHAQPAGLLEESTTQPARSATGSVYRASMALSGGSGRRRSSRHSVVPSILAARLPVHVRWKPLFKDPTFRGESARRISQGSIDTEETTRRRISHALTSTSAVQGDKEDTALDQMLSSASRQDVRKSVHQTDLSFVQEALPTRKMSDSNSSGFSDVSAVDEDGANSDVATPAKLKGSMVARKGVSPASSSSGLSDIMDEFRSGKAFGKPAVATSSSSYKAPVKVSNLAVIPPRDRPPSSCSGFSDVSVDVCEPEKPVLQSALAKERPSNSSLLLDNMMDASDQEDAMEARAHPAESRTSSKASKALKESRVSWADDKLILAMGLKTASAAVSVDGKDRPSSEPDRTNSPDGSGVCARIDRLLEQAHDSTDCNNSPSMNVLSPPQAKPHSEHSGLSDVSVASLSMSPLTTLFLP